MLEFVPIIPAVHIILWIAYLLMLCKPTIKNLYNFLQRNNFLFRKHLKVNYIIPLLLFFSRLCAVFCVASAPDSALSGISTYSTLRNGSQWPAQHPIRVARNISVFPAYVWQLMSSTANLSGLPWNLSVLIPSAANFCISTPIVWMFTMRRFPRSYP